MLKKFDPCMQEIALVDGSEMPESFYKYLRHAYQQRDQHESFQDLKIGTMFLDGVPWPEEFYRDLKASFEKAIRNYEECLGGRQREALNFPF